MSRVDRLALASLRRLDPERAHRLALLALKHGLVASRGAPAGPAVQALGLRFPSPVGLAGGFDKDGEAIDALLALGFGYVEVGTVTPRPQAGNPRPRLFRLAGDRAIINRMGFNNAGHDALAQGLEARRAAGRPGIVGVNIGANRDSEDRVADYAEGVRRFAPLCEYLAVNVSSPNTPGLRDLQAGEALNTLFSRILEVRAGLSEGTRTPILVKLAPDLGRTELTAIVEAVLRNRVDGMILTNTTVARPPLRSNRHVEEAGGLSGPPLFRRSTALLAEARRLAGPDLALVGVGGIEDADTAWEKVQAGADLVQVYTGFVFGGPALASTIAARLRERLAGHGLATLREVRDASSRRWATTLAD